MPQVTYNPTQGLVQSAGSGIFLGGNQLVGTLRKVVDGSTASTSTVITGTYTARNTTLTSADSGCVLLPVTATLYTLPAVASSSGWNAIFLNTTAAFTSSIAAPTACIKGVVFNNTNAATLARTNYSSTAQSRLTFVNPKVGDFLRIRCDGTNYFIEGWCNSSTSGTI
jgi:hypothetical protein